MAMHHFMESYVCAETHRDIFKIEGTRSSKKIQEPILDPPTAAAASNLSNAYRFHSSYET